MKELLNSIKGVIFLDTPTPVTPITTLTPTTTFSHAAVPPIIQPAEVSPTLVSDLQRKIYPVSGPLAAFMATFNSLESAIPNESARLSAAISVCNAQGGSIGGIVSDLGIARAKLSTEKQAFEDARIDKIHAEVDARERSFNELGDTIAARERELAGLVAKRDILMREAEAARGQIDARAKEYGAVFAKLAVDLDSMNYKLSEISKRSQVT